MYQGALSSLKELRAKAGLPEPELEDTPALRADAVRFAHQLASAPDAGTAEIELLADHAGAQAFWFMVAANWEQMEMMLLPPAFELLPNPMPYEVVSRCFIAMLATGETLPEPAPAEADALGIATTGAVCETLDV